MGRFVALAGVCLRAVLGEVTAQPVAVDLVRVRFRVRVRVRVTVTVTVRVRVRV